MADDYPMGHRTSGYISPPEDAESTEYERYYGAEEAYYILRRETARRAKDSERPYHFIVGGKLVRDLSIIERKKGENGDTTLHRDRIAWRWDLESEKIEDLIEAALGAVLPMIRRYGDPQFGILVIFDAEMVEPLEIEDLHDTLMALKVKMDKYNEKYETEHYIMLGLCVYSKTSVHRHYDARIASANAVMSAFNSFLNKRPTIDLNRYLLDMNEGRPLNIRGEKQWKVDQDRYEGLEFTQETLHMLTEKVVEFLDADDGMRNKDNDLTFPYKREKRGTIKVLPGYKFPPGTPLSTKLAQVEGIDPEAVYWVRETLLRRGYATEEVPPLPELDWYEYSFKPWRKGEFADMQTRTVETEKDERTIRREKREESRQEKWLEKLGLAFGFDKNLPAQVTEPSSLALDSTIDSEDETESPRL